MTAIIIAGIILIIYIWRPKSNKITPRNPEKGNILNCIFLGILPRMIITGSILYLFIWVEKNRIGFKDGVPSVIFWFQFILAFGGAMTWYFINGTRELGENKLGCLKIFGWRQTPARLGEWLAWLLIVGQGDVPILIIFGKKIIEWDEWEGESDTTPIPPQDPEDNPRPFKIRAGNLSVEEESFDILVKVSLAGGYWHENRLKYPNKKAAEKAAVAVHNAVLRQKVGDLTSDVKKVGDALNKRSELMRLMLEDIKNPESDLCVKMGISGFVATPNYAITDLVAEKAIKDAGRELMESELEAAGQKVVANSVAESTQTILGSMGDVSKNPWAQIVAPIVAIAARALSIGTKKKEDDGGDQQ